MYKIIISTVFLCLVISVTAQQKFPSGINITDLKGKIVKSEDLFLDNLPVVVTFWASWCSSCMEELEAIKEMQTTWEGKVRILAISIDDSRSVAKVSSLVSGKKWPFTVYFDSNRELLRAMNATNIPFAVVVNQQGRIIFKHTGYTPGGEIELVEKAIGSN